jgi:hypothetical protein
VLGLRRLHAGVLVVGAEEEHVVDRDLVHPIAAARAHPAQRHRLRRRRQRRRRRCGQQALQGREQLAVVGGRPRERTPHALHRARQALGRHRLEHVVDRLVFEGRHRVLVVGGHEHHARAAFDALGHLQAGEAGHLDVEEGQIGFERRDALGRFDAVRGHVHDLEFGPGRAELGRQLAREVRLVVGEQGARLHGAVCSGNVRRARVPGAASLNARLAASP